MPVHGPQDSGFDAMFNLVLFIVIGGFIYAIGSMIWRTARNIGQPLLTRRARLVGRRQSTSGGGGTDDKQSSVTTWYYVTFEFADGAREEFSVSASQYGLLAEGDVGTLQSQGTWFKGFDRERAPAARE